MQIVYDLYENGRVVSTYQSRGKALAALNRLPYGHGDYVKKRTVKHGESPRWQKPVRRQPMFNDGAFMARALADLLKLHT